MFLKLRKKYFLVSLICFFFFSFFLAGSVNARLDNTWTNAKLSSTGKDIDDNDVSAADGGAGYAVVKYGKLFGFLQQIVNVVLSFVSVYFFAHVLYGGFKWMTARDKEEEAQKAMATIRGAIIGMFISAAAYAIVYLVSSNIAGLLYG